MAEVLSAGAKFPAKLVNELVQKVKGHSALARLSDQEPIAFTGNEYMVFDMPSEISVLAENEQKAGGGVTAEPVRVIPIKFEYGARVSSEFVYASEEEQLDTLSKFSDGFARKVARGLDIAAMHGVNPRTGQASEVIGTNNFDAQVTRTVTYDATKPDENLEEAIGKVKEMNSDLSGIALSPAIASKLGQMKTDGGAYLYPEFKFGATPESLGGMAVDVNSTVSFNDVDQAIVGDFQEAFKWGIAKEIDVEVIPYGDPDNTGKDLKGHNQVYLRSEVYIGWAVLAADSFARIIAG